MILCNAVNVMHAPPTSLPHSVDTIGTIIANNRATAMRPDFLQDEKDQLYHIVRPDEAGAAGEGRGKIISEVFLTRLLSTKVASWCTLHVCACVHTYVHALMLTRKQPLLSLSFLLLPFFSFVSPHHTHSVSSSLMWTTCSMPSSACQKGTHCRKQSSTSVTFLTCRPLT